jgi:hypothetical protein
MNEAMAQWGLSRQKGTVKKTGTEHVERTKTTPFLRTVANITPYPSDVRPKFESLWTQPRLYFRQPVHGITLKSFLCALFFFLDYSPLCTAERDWKVRVTSWCRVLEELTGSQLVKTVNKIIKRIQNTRKSVRA